MTDRGAERAHALMLLLLLASGVVSICCAETIPVGDGFGWDGTFYGAFAKNFYRHVFIEGVDAYYVQRIVPSAVVHYGLRLLGFPLDNHHIILGFGVYNLALLLGACALWRLIADELGISLRGRWLGFVGLFVNFATLKFSFCYPVLTDVTAFALGTLMLCLCLRNCAWALFAVTVIGSFAWPLVGPTGFLLLLFPKRAIAPPERDDSRLATAAAAVLTALTLGAFIFLYYYRQRRVVGLGPVIPVVESVVYLSALIYTVYVFFATKTLFGGIDLSYLLRVMRSIRARNLGLAMLAITLPQAAIHALSTTAVQELSVREFVQFFVLLPVTRPFVFFVSHVVYFGPVMLFCLFLWKPVCRLAREYGPGLVLVVFLGVLIGLTPESRQSMLALPILVTLLVKATEQYRWPVSLYWFLGVAALVFSKVWLRINAWPASEPLTDADLPRRLNRYFMNQGPYMPTMHSWFRAQRSWSPA